MENHGGWSLAREGIDEPLSGCFYVVRLRRDVFDDDSLEVFTTYEYFAGISCFCAKVEPEIRRLL